MLKRVFDVLASLVMLILLCVPLLVVAVAVRMNMGAPVLFRQRRTGFRERTFSILKFRTMRDAHDVQGRPLPDGERLTPLGRFLRRTSLDELPELINVLLGQMSLVGPRPLLERYDPWYTDEERRRFTVRPGITGLAQVRGRNLVSWDDRLAADVEYVDQQSFPLDIRILYRTMTLVLQREGVVDAPGEAMLDFDEERRAAAEAGEERT